MIMICNMLSTGLSCVWVRVGIYCPLSWVFTGNKLYSILNYLHNFMVSLNYFIMQVNLRGIRSHASGCKISMMAYSVWVLWVFLLFCLLFSLQCRMFCGGAAVPGGGWLTSKIPCCLQPETDSAPTDCRSRVRLQKKTYLCVHSVQYTWKLGIYARKRLKRQCHLGFPSRSWILHREDVATQLVGNVLPP